MPVSGSEEHILSVEGTDVLPSVGPPISAVSPPAESARASPKPLPSSPRSSCGLIAFPATNGAVAADALGAGAASTARTSAAVIVCSANRIGHDAQLTDASVPGGGAGRAQGRVLGAA